MIFPYLYTDMQAKHVVILSILSAYALSAKTQDNVATVQDTIRFEDGSWYYGQIADSLFNGHGKMVYADSTVYEGDWKDGLWDGKGELSYPDGDYYEGEFSKHEFSGYGTYIYTDGAKYEGYWKNGMFNGAGTMEYPDGSTYAGEWKDDKRNGLGVYYNASNGTLLRGNFLNDFYIPWTRNDNTGNRRLPKTREPDYPADGKLHLEDHTTIGISYGLGQFLSFHVDYHISDLFFAGAQLGFNTVSHRIGKESETTDDDTGEKVTLVGWDWYMNEILTEETYSMFKISGECGVSWNRFSLGTALGLGLDNTVRNCRSMEGNDSYYEPGTLYYREKITGVKFAYDIFAEFVPNIKMHWLDYISLRLGYSNLDRFHIGIGVVF